jgi:hypothetical protein
LRKKSQSVFGTSRNNHNKKRTARNEGCQELTPIEAWALVVFNKMARIVVVPETFVVIIGVCPLFYF